MHAPNAIATALHASTQTAQGGSRRQDVFALEQATDTGLTDSGSAEDERPVRNRLVTRDRNITLQSLDRPGTKGPHEGRLLTALARRRDISANAIQMFLYHDFPSRGRAEHGREKISHLNQHCPDDHVM
jgi:hypothetical protein